MSLPDLMLQGQIPAAGGTVRVYAYRYDGLQNFGEVTNAFQVAFGSQRGVNYFVLQAVRWHEILCAHPCFILRVTVDYVEERIFDKYTEQYCLDGCCVVPGGIKVDGTPVAPVVPTDTPVPLPSNWCEHETHVLEAEFDCYDPFSGEFYGGTGDMTFRKRTVIDATFRQMPREITRQISMSCRVQRTESIRKYELHSFEVFPNWKMDEIENMMQAPRLYLDGKPIIFSGGTPFERIHKCKDWNRLKAILEHCKVWQNTSCAPVCDDGATGARAAYYALPETTDVYRDDAGRVIGYSDTDLTSWMTAQNGVANAEFVADALPKPAKILKVIGSTPPSFLYVGAPVPSNKSFAVLDSATDPDYYAILGLPRDYKFCQNPVLSAPSFTEPVCAAPTFSDVSFRDSCKKPTLSDYTIA
ncbi:MAG: hypothetical protein EOP52_13500 [Sphingobacteriales bacterium]|nr:MAG: hypothetical protein EOP52_13500 [Sphingobacteriales bacterium]